SSLRPGRVAGLGQEPSTRASIGSGSQRRWALLHPFPVVHEGTLPGGCELVTFKDDGWLTVKRKLELDTSLRDRHRGDTRRTGEIIAHHLAADPVVHQIVDILFPSLLAV